MCNSSNSKALEALAERTPSEAALRLHQAVVDAIRTRIEFARREALEARHLPVPVSPEELYYLARLVGIPDEQIPYETWETIVGKAIIWAARFFGATHERLRAGERIEDGKQHHKFAGGGETKRSGRKTCGVRLCDRKALSQFRHAMEQEPTLKTDDEVYDWLIEEFRADNVQLPRRDTWKRYLRCARASCGEQKNGPRMGNETRSVVSAKRLDSRGRTKPDQR